VVDWDASMAVQIEKMTRAIWSHRQQDILYAKVMATLGYPLRAEIRIQSQSLIIMNKTIYCIVVPANAKLELYFLISSLSAPNTPFAFMYPKKYVMQACIGTRANNSQSAPVDIHCLLLLLLLASSREITAGCLSSN